MQDTANVTSCSLTVCAEKCLRKKIELLTFLSPLLNLFIRLWMARIFWLSGMTKIGNWDSTLWLFENEYKVPLLSVPVAAALATAAELLCPVLLVTGLGVRFAAFVLLIMTGVIEFTYKHYDEHYYWAMLLLVLIFYGAGKLSFDHAIRLRYWGKAK